MIGFRHDKGCLCGCQFVVGLRGKTVETIRVVRFRLKDGREELVAYSELADTPAREAGGL